MACRRLDHVYEGAVLALGELAVQYVMHHFECIWHGPMERKQSTVWMCTLSGSAANPEKRTSQRQEKQ